MELKTEYSLYDYQQDIINWMDKITKKPINNSKGGILYAQMGLGKTLTSLEYIRQRQKKQSLIICSKTLIQEWLNQINKFYKNTDNVFILHRDYNNLKNITKEKLLKYDIIITTYHMISNANKIKKNNYTRNLSEKYIYKLDVLGWCIDRHDFKPITEELNGIHSIYNINWDLLIIDECQTLTNWKTNFFKSIYSLCTKEIFGLSGTPIKNNKNEFIALLKLLKVNSFFRPVDWKNDEIKNSYYDLFYKVDYKKVNKKLPKQTDIKIEMTLSKKDHEKYKLYVNKLSLLCNLHENEDENKNNKKKIKFAKVIGLLTRLRQICVDPYLLTLNENSISEYMKIMYHKKIKNFKNVNHGLKFGNNKLYHLKKIILEILNRNEKVIVFSSFTSYLKLVNKHISNNSTIILSSDSIIKRNKKINNWKNNTNNNILFLNYRIGAEGLNLVEANNVILIDTWWNFALEEQAIARVKRINQNKDIKVYRLLNKNTIESLIIKKCIFKANLYEKIKLGIDKKDIEKSKLSMANIKNLIHKMEHEMKNNKE